MLVDGFLGSQLARAVVGASFDVADAGRADRMDELEILVAKAEARVAEARAAFAGATELARRVREGLDPVPQAERAATIDVLYGLEKTIAEMGRLGAERALANERRAAVATPLLLPLLQRMTALMDEDVQLHAAALRDVRWAILEVEAAAEPPVDGPILASSADIDALFQELRAAP